MSLYFGQIVIGPAGGGKSTYCKHLQEMASTLRRNILIFNMDPAAEQIDYKCNYDIRELICLQDVMEEIELGPNGGLIYCFQYLLGNKQWLQDILSELGQDDYIMFDCPGQIQLYSHLSVFQEFIQLLQNAGFSLLSVYLMDASFCSATDKLISGMLQALACVVALEVPAITVLSKCDMLQDEGMLEKTLQMLEYCEDDFKGKELNKKQRLRQAVMQILRHNNQVSLSKLNLQDEDSVRDLLNEADIAIQYGENIQPDDRLYDEAQDMLTHN